MIFRPLILPELFLLLQQIRMNRETTNKPSKHSNRLLNIAIPPIFFLLLHRPDEGDSQHAKRHHSLAVRRDAQ